MRICHGLAFVLALLLTGCASLNSIHRTYRVSGVDGASVVTVDAKQRHLLISPEFELGGAGKKDKITRLRMCAEASPDVFSAYASSLSGNLGWGATERSAQFANSIAETAATVERTQTINLLRESMYRTCERYLSGALNREQFIIQAARDQKSMVAVLAIEQLTGAIRAKPTIISGPATSAAVIDGAESAKLIEQFRVEEGAAKTRSTAADTTYASAKKTGKCDSVAEKPAADAKDPTADEWVACKSAETMVAQRKDELKAATGRLDKALTLAADFVSRRNASTTGGTNDGASYTATTPGDGAIIAVADAVREIVTSPGINEPLMFCIAYFQRAKEELNGEILGACTKIVVDQAVIDKKRQEVGLGIFNAAGYRNSVTQGIAFDNFNQRLLTWIGASDPKTLAKKMADFETSAGTKHGLGAACTSHDVCRRAVIDSDLAESYKTQQSKLEDALKNLAKP